MSDLVDFEELDDFSDIKTKWLTPAEVERAKEKLFDFFKNDLRLSSYLSTMLVGHALAIKAMYNAGYSYEQIMKWMNKKNLVEDFHLVNKRLKAMNKNYARASNTIATLRGQLARKVLGQ